MRFFQVEAARTHGFPQKGDGIQTDDPRPLRDVEQEDVEKFEKDVRILPIQIHLIRAESGPDIARAVPRLDLCQQR